MMKDMVVQLGKEADEDEEIYDSLRCWCETNDKGKATSIEGAKARVSDLRALIDEYQAASTRLSTEIGSAKQGLEKNSQSLDKASSLRRNEVAKFNEDEKQALVTIANLKSSIATLSKHHDGASALLEVSDKQAPNDVA